MFRAITNHDGQNQDNLIKLNDATNGCCGSADSACQYDITIATANTVTALTFKKRDGTNQTKTFTAVSGAANVIAAFRAAIESDGYEGDDDAVRGITSEVSGSNTIYHITGDMVIVSATHSGGTATATTKCTRINRCTFFYAWPGSGSTSTFTINGVNATLASFTLAGSTAAQVITGIEGLANWPATADVNVVETATAFEITITDNAVNTFELAGNEFERSNCAPGYSA